MKYFQNLVIKRLFYEYSRERYEDAFDDYMISTIIKDRLRTVLKTGKAIPFIEYPSHQVLPYLCNLSSIRLEEKHLKIIPMKFLSTTQAYIPMGRL